MVLATTVQTILPSAILSHCLNDLSASLVSILLCTFLCRMSTLCSDRNRLRNKDTSKLL
jgi:hypothetical protein